MSPASYRTAPPRTTMLSASSTTDKPPTVTVPGMEFTYDERARAVVLVEGLSDRRALEALAARRGRDLGAEGVSVVSIGGATNIRSALDVFGPRGRDARLAG